MRTGFVWHERYFWFDTGRGLPVLPGCQPSPHWDTPESKRRIKNLLDASGLTDALVPIRRPAPATRDDLLRIHTAADVVRVKALSDTNGGETGVLAHIGHGDFDIALLAVGGCMAAVDAVLAGAVDNASDGKPIIFMTQDDPKTAPVDLRHFEFIHYDLARDHDLLLKLDNAIQNSLGGVYTAIFDQAMTLLQKFNVETESAYSPASFEEFQARVIRGERLEDIPSPDDSGFSEFLLPKIIAEATDISVIRKVDKWLSHSAGTPLVSGVRPNQQNAADPPVLGQPQDSPKKRKSAGTRRAADSEC